MAAEIHENALFEVQGAGKVIWPDGTEISGQQFQDTVGMVLEAYARGRKDGRAEGARMALEAEHAWLDESSTNADKEIYGERYLSGFRAAAGCVKFHAATPEAFRHLKEPDNGRPAH